MKKLFSLILGLSLFSLPAMPSVFAGNPEPGAPAAKTRAPRHKFTKEEDKRILEFVQANGLKGWVHLAAALGNGVTAKQCKQRYNV